MLNKITQKLTSNLNQRIQHRAKQADSLQQNADPGSAPVADKLDISSEAGQSLGASRIGGLLDGIKGSYGSVAGEDIQRAKSDKLTSKGSRAKSQSKTSRQATKSGGIRSTPGSRGGCKR